jgi:hypothetical protein
MKAKALAILALILTSITVAALGWNLYSFARSDTIEVRSAKEASISSPVIIEIPSFHKYDRIYLTMNADIPVAAIEVQPRESLIQLPKDVEGIGTDLTYRGLSQEGFFYVANSTGNARFLLTVWPRIPYAVRNLEGNLSYELLDYSDREGKYFDLKMTAQEFTAAGFAQLALVHLFDRVAEPDLQIAGEIRLLGGRIAYANLILGTDTELRAFRVATPPLVNGSSLDFHVDASTKELMGRTGLEFFFGQKILFIGFGIGLDKKDWTAGQVPQAEIAVGDITIVNGGKISTIEATPLNEYKLDYTLFVFQKFQPEYMQLMLAAALISEVAALTFLAIRIWRKDRSVEN